MSKRQKSGNNTLLNYFSPTAKNSSNENSINRANLQTEAETPKKSKEKRPAQANSDNDEPIHASKRRRRIISADSSGSDNDSQKMDVEQTRSTTRERIHKKLAELPATKTPTRKSLPQPLEDAATVWLHEKFDFLQPGKIRDLEHHRSNDPDYNARTLYVPQEFLVQQTPAMRQWWEIKSKHFDCVLFFKVGKFYELYHMDAVTGVNELALSFMRGEFAHSGFPEIAYGRFSNSLVELGYKVARVEQTETPDMLAARLAVPGTPKTKFDKVVRRELCQVSNRATRVSAVQDADTKLKQPEHLCAIIERRNEQSCEFGVCFVDTAVGVFHLGRFSDDQHCSGLLTLFSEYPPAAILEERGNLKPDTKSLLKTSIGNVKFETLSANKEFYSAEKTIETLEMATYFKSESGTIDWPQTLHDMIFIDGGKCREGRQEFSSALRCLGAVHFYLKTCMLDVQLFSLRQIENYEVASNRRHQLHMVLDAGALRNLHILGTDHSLQFALDRCGSIGGKRLLRQWICRPLCDIKNIKSRQQAVSELVSEPNLLNDLSSLLGQLPDLEREVAKIHALGNYVRSRTHPDSRAILYEEAKYSRKKINDFMATLQAFQKCSIIVDKCKSLKSDLIVQYSRESPKGIFPVIADTLEYFNHAFDHAEAKKEGKIIPKPGIDDDYDRTIEKLEDLKKFSEEYLELQEKFFGCKLNYFGRDKKRFQLEVPEKAASKKVNESYQLEGTKKGAKPCKRYSTTITRKLLSDMLATEKENREIVHDLNRKIFEKFSTNYDMWMDVCKCMSSLDCLVSLALYATSQSVEMCVPEIVTDVTEAVYEVEDGVHPFIPHVEDFIPNSVQLGCDDSHPPLMIITGANMGGKTTLMRQTALHAIMAQIGSWVPAKKLCLSLVDRVFTRLGARDDIMAGRSTFHVELREALSVLQHATSQSVVLLDELGRGTSTHDGSAIAAAYVRDLARLQCRAVFSTHYHGVVSRFVRDPLVQVCHMACRVEGGASNEDDSETVTFLYKIKDGACPRSYGFNAARLAGIPHAIIQEGQRVSKAIETDTLSRKLFLRLFKQLDDVGSILKNLRRDHYNLSLD